MAALLMLLLASASTGAPIRISGSPDDRPLIEALEQGFAATEPQVRFANQLHGPDSTLAGTYTGTIDIAFMARELRQPMERMAYEWAMLQPPLAIPYALGGLTGTRLSTQIGVFVNATNPVASLAIAQLDAALGAEHLRGPANARTWGDLGAVGAWDTRPIHVYGPEVDSVAALFVRRLVMKDSRKWNEGYREMPADREVLDRVAHDADGLAFAPVSDPPAGVKLVALSAKAGDAPVLPDREDVTDGRYPLARSVEFVVAHDKGRPVSPPVDRFAAYILSPAGQTIVARVGPYLPLGDAAADAARQALEKAE